MSIMIHGLTSSIAPVCFTPLDEFVYMISPIYSLFFLSSIRPSQTPGNGNLW
jgi:hypothetical protein